MSATGGSSNSISPETQKTPMTPKLTPTKITPTKRKPSKPKTPKNNQQLISLLSSAVSAAHTFLCQNDLCLLPSQSLYLESLLSSFPSPFLPSVSPSPSSYFFHRFLSTASSDFDARWPHFFRMSRQTFSRLLTLLSPSLLSSLPPSIPQEAALAATLFRLSHGASYKTVARWFGLDSSDAACLAFYTVCKAVNEKFGNLFEFRQDWERIVVGFGWISLPNCCGVLGYGRFGVDGDALGKHGSLLVQALVDSEGRFLDISAGWPCSMKPHSILNQTKFYLGIEETRECLDGPSYKLSDGNSIPQYILGDSCFPLLPWLLTPYIRPNEENSLGWAEREFNAAHSRAMGLVSTAFGRVKARWQLLGKRWKEECVEFFPFAIVMGCLLHNFLIECSEPLPEDCVGYFKEEEMPVFEGEVDESGRRIRDVLAQHLSRDN